MPEAIENRMVVDSEWKRFKNNDMNKVMAEPGYHEMGTHVFVPQTEAFTYALERCLNGAEADRKEFKEMLVEWFYSGNWVREE